MLASLQSEGCFFSFSESVREPMEAESTTHGKIRKYDRHSKNGRGVHDDTGTEADRTAQIAVVNRKQAVI